MIHRLLSIIVGIGAGVLAIKLLKNDQKKNNIFELSEHDYVEIPFPDESDSNNTQNSNS